MKKLLFLVMALMVVFAAGCGGTKETGGSSGSSGSDNGVSVDVVKIGALHPLSGGLASEGQEMRDAARLAIEEINEAGGIKSLGGAKVELIEADSEGIPEKGVSEVQRLDREGVVGIIGTYSSGVALPATQEAERAQIPFVADIASANEITERGFKYTFRIQPPASTMATNFLSYFEYLNGLVDSPLKTVVLVHEDSVFGTSIADLIEKEAKDHGIEILANMPHAASTADLSSTINKINSLKPDVVVTTTYLRDGTLLVSGLKESNYQPKAIIGVANGAFSNAKFINEDTAINQYLMDVNYTINPQSELANKVKEEFNTKFNRNLGPNAAYSYTAIKVLMDAIERAGSTNRADIQKALTETNMADHILPQGPIVFDEKGQNINAQAVLNQIIDAQSMVVYPEDYKNADPVYPIAQ
ncbi:ABC transporter substrate-binding protein [Calidifontibacillus oryziterrae]|uniref:ABC transporter substrate-binding protein n=1 Tax=Calidifontibacillus oryziterrae TaxID=1191699 RepID=UPI000306E580|nr:ABC transporter substrate-binding protein [Calidifontibacillus oryziterrae]